jgi:type VI secretion system lysozyme-like protein
VIPISQQTSPADALFDRLSDHAPFSGHETDDAGFDIQESVIAELSRLLNTRRQREPYLRQTNVLDYGLPDWTAVGRHNAEEQARLLRIIQSTIQQYEPRLKNVRVEAVQNMAVQKAPPQNTPLQKVTPGSIALRIHAELRDNNAPLSLRLSLQIDKPAEVAHERID